MSAVLKEVKDGKPGIAAVTPVTPEPNNTNSSLSSVPSTTPDSPPRREGSAPKVEGWMTLSSRWKSRGCLRSLRECVCSVRTSFIFLLVGGLILNTTLLVVVSHFFTALSVDHLQTLNTHQARQYVASTVTSFFEMAETLLSHVEQYMQTHHHNNDFDFADEEFLRSNVAPFFASLEESVVSGNHPEYLVHSGFADAISGDIVGVKNPGNGKLVFFYHNESEANSSIPGKAGWSPMYFWPLSGGPSYDDEDVVCSSSSSSPWLLSPRSVRKAKAPHVKATVLPWYKGTVAASPSEYSSNGTIQWRVETTVLGNFTMTGSRRVYGVDSATTTTSQFLGVANVWIYAGWMPFMRTAFNDVEEGVVFLLTSDGRLFGTNTAPSDVFSPNEKGKEVPHNGPDSPNPIIATASQRIIEELRRNEDDDTTELPQSEVVSGPNHDRILLGALRFNASSLDLVVVTAMSYAYVNSKIDWSLGLSIGLSAGVLLCLAVLSIGLVACIIHPLRRLVQEMSKVEEMRLQDVKFGGSSCFSEIFGLQRAFSFTIKKLAEFRAFLPVHLFHDDDGDSVCDSPDDPFSTPTKDHPGRHQSDSDSSTDTIASEFSLMLSPTRIAARFGLFLQSAIRVIAVVRIDCVMPTHSGSPVLPVSPIRGSGPTLLGDNLLLDCIRTIFEAVVSLAKRFKGELLDYGISGFTLAFLLPRQASLFALRLSSVLRKMLLELSFVIAIDMGDVFLGNVGSATMRKRVICGGPVDFLRSIVERIRLAQKVAASQTKTSLQDEQVLSDRGKNTGSVWCSQAVHQKLHEVFVRFPADIVCRDNAIAVLFRIVRHSPIHEDEWMYELRDKETRALYENITTAVKLLRSNRPEEAKDKLRAFLHESTSTGKQWIERETQRILLDEATVTAKAFLSLCEKLQEKKMKFEDLSALTKSAIGLSGVNRSCDLLDGC